MIAYLTRPVALMLMMGLALSLAVACGSAEEGDTSTPAASAPAPAAPTSAPAPAAPAATGMDSMLGEKLNVAISNFASEIIDPHNASKDYGASLQTHAADYLVGVNVDNTYTNDWGWSDSWEMSADGATWTFTIREGMLAHDGVEVTAEDGVWNVTRWASDEGNNPGNSISAGWRNIFESAETIDNYKFQVNLNQPYAFVLKIVTPIGGSDMYIFPKHGWEDNGGTGEGFEGAGAPMTGYVDFTERELGQYTRFSRYDDYYGTDKYQFKFKNMEVVQVPEDAPRLALVKTGKADIANMSGPFAEEILEAGLVMDGPRKVDVVYLSMYQTYDEGHCTNDVRVRKAMNLATDTEAIRAAIYPEGASERPITIFSTDYDESYNPNLEPYGYDPEEAKRLLAEAGCEGFEFNALGYFFPAGPEMRDIADAVVTYLKAVDIEANFLSVEFAATNPMIGAQEGESFSSEYGPPTGGSHWQLGGRNFADKIRVHGLCQGYGGGVCNLDDQEKWKTNYLAYAAIMDEDERITYAQELGQELYEGYYGVPVAYRNAIWALNPDTICGDWEPIDGTPSHLMFNTLTPCDAN